MIPICILAHSSYLLQPLNISCFAVLKRAYGRMVEFKIRSRINYINKLDFLEVYPLLRIEVFKSETIKNSFLAAGLVPHVLKNPVSGIPDGSAFASRTETMLFLAPSTVKASKKSYLCRWAGCKTCAVGPDVVTVHADCLEVYLEHAASYEERKEPTKEKVGNEDKETGKGDDKNKKDTTDDKKINETENAALQRLWIASSWRTPWKKAPFPSLLQCDNARMSMPSPALLHRLGLPGMARMPPELASTVRDLSKDSPLWRLNAAARLALSLAEYEKTETYGDDPAALPASILLSEVEAWERGRLLVRRVVSDEKKPELAEETIATDSFIRLAIDTYGLLHIKRLPARPAYNGTTSAGKLAYTLCEAKTLNGAMFISRCVLEAAIGETDSR